MFFQNQLLISNALCFLNLLFQVYLLWVYLYLLSTYAVSPGLVKNGNNFFSLAARAFDIIFYSIFKKEIGLQFWINLLSLLDFSINLITASLWEKFRIFNPIGSLWESIKILLTSMQNL